MIVSRAIARLYWTPPSDLNAILMQENKNAFSRRLSFATTEEDTLEVEADILPTRYRNFVPRGKKERKKAPDTSVRSIG